MSQTVLYRIAAVALVVGAVLVTAGNLLAPQGNARAAVESLLYSPLALVVLLGGLLVMAGWPAVYLRQRAESGVLGFVGFVAVLAAGMLLLVGFPLIQVLIFPWIATMQISTKTLSNGPDSFTVFFAVASCAGYLAYPFQKRTLMTAQPLLLFYNLSMTSGLKPEACVTSGLHRNSAFRLRRAALASQSDASGMIDKHPVLIQSCWTRSVLKVTFLAPTRSACSV